VHILSYILIILGILSNVLMILGLIKGLRILDKELPENIMARFTTVLGIIFLLYVISMFSLSILSFIKAVYNYGLVFLLFIAMPFIIGYTSSSERVKLYTYIQIISNIAGILIILASVRHIFS